MNGYFPHLKTLHLWFYSPEQLKDLHVKNVGEFLKINPQIECMLIKYFTVNLLKEVNEQLPNLKTLKLFQRAGDSDDFLKYDGDDIHFKHLNMLHLSLFIYKANVKPPTKIFFDQIEIFDPYKFI